MLKQIAKELFVSRAWILSIAFLIAVGVVVGTSQPFQACSKEQYHHAEAENFEKSIPSLSVAFDVYRICLGHFTKDNAEAIIAAFTIILALSTIFLWVATRDLVIGAEQTANRQLRAYVFIDGGLIQSITSDKGRIFISANCNFKNFGQTPAYKFRMWTKLHIFDTKAPVFDSWVSVRESILGPGAVAISPVRQGPVDSVDLAAVRTGEKSIFIWGEIKYDDVFGKSRYFRFYSKNGHEIPGTGWQIVSSDKPEEGN